MIKQLIDILTNPDYESYRAKQNDVLMFSLNCALLVTNIIIAIGMFLYANK